jgi:nucleotide-binding universal stress UspA family protein
VKTSEAMCLKTILVHLDPTARCSVRVALAAGLARAHGSLVAGLLPTGRFDGTLPAGVVLPRDEDVAAATTAYIERGADRVAAGFRQQMAGCADVRWELRRSDRLVLDALVSHGRASDLVVLGEEDPQEPPEAAPRGLVASVMLEVGRPVLVVPCFDSFAGAGANVLVAWDGSRAAAVAMCAALSLTRPASRVTLVAFRHPGEPEREDDLLPPEQVRWFERHGIRASVRREIVDGGIAEALLSSASDMHADLLVMGGYGHARWRERMLGGVTEQMLAWMTLPVLFAN